MDRPKLDPEIMKQGKSWGYNYDSMEGCGHDPADDKVTSDIVGKDVTVNVMSKMDTSHAKPAKDNPGFDKSFWAKADPQTDTVEGFKLTRKLKD